MSGELPADLRVPSLAMAKPVARVPKPGLLPGGRLYEPKRDGFRWGSWSRNPRLSVATSCRSRRIPA